MPTKTWKSISKFRLFTIVALSLLTSLSLMMTDELWRMKDLAAALLQAAIAGFAYLQCPTIGREEEMRRKGDGEKEGKQMKGIN